MWWGKENSIFFIINHFSRRSKTFLLLGIFLLIRDPAPMITLSPIVTFGRTVEPAPTNVELPIETPPQIVTQVLMSKSLIIQS